MSERDELIQWIEDLKFMTQENGKTISYKRADKIARFIIAYRNTTVQKVVGPLNPYRGLGTHGGIVYTDIDKVLKLADEVCKGMI